MEVSINCATEDKGAQIILDNEMFMDLGKGNNSTGETMGCVLNFLALDQRIRPYRNWDAEGRF